MLHKNYKTKKKWEKNMLGCGWPIEATVIGFEKWSNWSSNTMLTLVPITPQHQ
jgi:hypothetical protein